MIHYEQHMRIAFMFLCDSMSYIIFHVFHVCVACAEPYGWVHVRNESGSSLWHKCRIPCVGFHLLYVHTFHTCLTLKSSYCPLLCIYACMSSYRVLRACPCIFFLCFWYDLISLHIAFLSAHLPLYFLLIVCLSIFVFVSRCKYKLRTLDHHQVPRKHVYLHYMFVMTVYMYNCQYIYTGHYACTMPLYLYKGIIHFWSLGKENNNFICIG